jgi:hypothetical protein
MSPHQYVVSYFGEAGDAGLIDILLNILVQATCYAISRAFPFLEMTRVAGRHPQSFSKLFLTKTRSRHKTWPGRLQCRLGPLVK